MAGIRQKQNKKNKKYLSFFLPCLCQSHPDNKLSTSKYIHPFDWHFIDKNVLAKAQAVAALKYEKWWTAFCDLYLFSMWWMDITYPLLHPLTAPQKSRTEHWIIRSVIAVVVRIPSFCDFEQTKTSVERSYSPCANNLWEKKKWEKNVRRRRKTGRFLRALQWCLHGNPWHLYLCASGWTCLKTKGVM